MKKLEDYQHLYNDIELIDGKLPLRHLSDMTDVEILEQQAIVNNFKTDGKITNMLMRDAARTHYLLSKHFDIFGLIESGLAIDKTTTI